MCVAIPGKVIEILGEEAVVAFGSITKKVNVMLIENLQINDYLIIHGGCAIDKMSRDEGEETIKVFKELINEMDVNL